MVFQRISAAVLILIAAVTFSVRAAEPVTIVSPAEGAVIPGNGTFELHFTSDPTITGTAYRIIVGSFHGGNTGFSDGSYEQNYYSTGTDHQINLPVPRMVPNKPIKVRVISYWLGDNYQWSVNVQFPDSVPVISVAQVDIPSPGQLHVKLLGIPALAGTSLRLELRGPGGIYRLANIYDYTQSIYEWTGAIPPVQPGSYAVYVFSEYREAHQIDPFASIYPDLIPLDVSPLASIVWPGGGTHDAFETVHVLWNCKPELFGTAARIELVRENSVQAILGYEWNCQIQNDTPVLLPAGGASGYSIRVVSCWLEAHRELGLPAQVNGAPFTLGGNAVRPKLTEYPGSDPHWEPNADGRFELSFRCDPATWGTATRIELLDSTGRVYPMGTVWNTQAENTVLLPDPYLSWRAGMRVQIVSCWLEAHPDEHHPVKALANYTYYFTLISTNPLFMTLTNIEPAQPSPLLRIGYHAITPVVGTAFRFDLIPMNQTGNSYTLGWDQTDTTDTTRVFPIPNLRGMTTETAFYVNVHSYWQESIGGATVDVKTPWLIYLQ